jgi:hypothetical protein
MLIALCCSANSTAGRSLIHLLTHPSIRPSVHPPATLEYSSGNWVACSISSLSFLLRSCREGVSSRSATRCWDTGPAAPKERSYIYWLSPLLAQAPVYAQAPNDTSKPRAPPVAGQAALLDRAPPLAVARHKVRTDAVEERVGDGAAGGLVGDDDVACGGEERGGFGGCGVGRWFWWQARLQRLSEGRGESRARAEKGGPPPRR